MADKIVVLNEGRVEQVGSPMDLYHKPCSRFVAEFIGSPAMNVFAPEGNVNNLPVHGQAAFIGCRPEHFEVVPSGQGHLETTVRVKEQLGGESLLYLSTSSNAQLVAKVSGDDTTANGAEIGLRIPENRLYQFDASGRAL